MRQRLTNLRFGALRRICSVLGHRDHWWTVVDDDLSRTPIYEFSICQRCVRCAKRPLPKAAS